MAQSQPRAIAYNGGAPGYGDGRDEDYSPPNENSRAGRAEKKPRKRNSVACARCRKRKIKCTGDLHDGNGCEACQTAGTSPNTCFYLRVNSHQLNDVALQSPPESEWPYSVPTPTTYASSVPRITSDPSQYALANANMLPPSTTGPYLGHITGRTTSFNEISHAQYPVTPTRQPFASNYPTNLDNLNQYDMQPSRHGYPLQMSQAPTTGFSNPDPTHHWTPLPSNNRQLYHNLSFDQDVSSSYGSPTYLYSTATAASLPAVTSEAPLMFPGLSPLGTHLPSHGAANRVLPNPTSIHSSIDSRNGSIQEGESEMGILHPQGRDSWDLGRITTGTSQGSVSSAVQGSISASGPSSSNASSSPGDSTGFGFIPMAHSTSDDHGASTSNYHSVTNATTMHNPDNSPTSVFQSNMLVNNSQLPSLNSSFNLYGSAPPNGLPTSEGALASTQSHSRILQPQPRHSPSFDLFSGSFDTNPQRAHKNLKSNAKGH